MRITPAFQFFGFGEQYSYFWSHSCAYRIDSATQGFLKIYKQRQRKGVGI